MTKKIKIMWFICEEKSNSTGNITMRSHRAPLLTQPTSPTRTASVLQGWVLRLQGKQASL